MPRPARPILSYDGIVESALALIDADGLEAFSVKRLARAMNVRGPSLYYYFPDKAAILEAVARLIVRSTPRPRDRAPEHWIEYFVTQSLNFRRTILRHANAAPLLLEFMPRDVFAPTYEVSARFLAEAGIPDHQRVLIMDGLDRFTLGAALTEAMKPAADRKDIFPHFDPVLQPSLARSVSANELTPEALWAESIRTFLRGIVAGRHPGNADEGAITMRAAASRRSRSRRR
ncbi:TetR family transcriptional regulator [Amycolatopsis sp. K13G38]|uniref:TetR family transcriptional regulator n=1 Tax=Amycolatopsis acididurans TaxID=2724524 RepID=A0ABX1JE37_9PSEU|nr:TetR family transcriptional regulator [Amycolatopsis acididurans]NKQ56746.1 TetR family transcriptional regulator [Amycolatopsis acididurans]